MAFLCRGIGPEDSPGVDNNLMKRSNFALTEDRFSTEPKKEVTFSEFWTQRRALSLTTTINAPSPSH